VGDRNTGTDVPRSSCPVVPRSYRGTLAAVPTRANIRAGALNKGGSGDPGERSAVSRPVRIQAVSDIYTRDHSRCYLLIVTLLASLSLGGAKVLGSSLYRSPRLVVHTANWEVNSEGVV
jgi:hypothetical protein